MGYEEDTLTSWSKQDCAASLGLSNDPTAPDAQTNNPLLLRDDWRSSELDRVFSPSAPQPSAGGHLPEDDATRALYPMADGCLDYFPNALAEVSRISYEGNQKHNPGEPMHWNRGKSLDHRNKILRHTVESKGDSETSICHAAQAAWRALAHLQQLIERVRGVPMAPGARPA